MKVYHSDAGMTVELLHGDCKKILRTLPAKTVNLIITSPPYALQRKRQYGGVKPDVR